MTISLTAMDPLPSSFTNGTASAIGYVAYTVANMSLTQNVPPPSGTFVFDLFNPGVYGTYTVAGTTTYTMDATASVLLPSPPALTSSDWIYRATSYGTLNGSKSKFTWAGKDFVIVSFKGSISEGYNGGDPPTPNVYNAAFLGCSVSWAGASIIDISYYSPWYSGSPILPPAAPTSIAAIYSVGDQLAVILTGTDDNGAQQYTSIYLSQDGSYSTVDPSGSLSQANAAAFNGSGKGFASNGTMSFAILNNDDVTYGAASNAYYKVASNVNDAFGTTVALNDLTLDVYDGSSVSSFGVDISALGIPAGDPYEGYLVSPDGDDFIFNVIDANTFTFYGGYGSLAPPKIPRAVYPFHLLVPLPLGCIPLCEENKS